MNVLHMKYAVEVAKIGSINKAAEELYVAQPNLSRAIKELEADLGITVFSRSSKGMVLTNEGKMFIKYAENVLQQIDEIETVFRKGISQKQRFSISVPRASYISDAFAKFTKELSKDPAEIYYMETNSSVAINNILNSDYNLGIIRYASMFDEYFKDMLEEKELVGEMIAEFKYVIIMNNDNPLAKKETLSFSDLSPLVEISHGDPYVASLKINVAMQEEHADDTKRQVFLFERGGQFDILMENPETFMWVSPIPQKLLERYNLAQKVCVDYTRMYKDVLIHKNDYVLSELDKLFITKLVESKRRCL